MVNWQRNNTYRDIKMFERDSGFPYADYKRMNYPCPQDQSVGTAIAMTAPSIFMSIICKAADGSFGGGGSKSNSTRAQEADPNAEAVAKQIKGEINDILAKYKNEGITNVDDLNAHLQGLLDDADVTVKSLKDNIDTNKKVLELENRNSEIETRLGEINTLLGTGEGSITSQINSLDTQIKTAEANGEDTSALQSKKQELTKQKEKLEKEKASLEKEKTENIKNIDEAKKAISIDSTQLNKFQDIYKDIEDLNILLKQLDKAEGKDSIESLKNEQTADIAGLIKQMNEAEIKKDNKKAEKIKKELKTAVEEYVKNPDNKNKTILNYAQKLGIK